MHFLSKNIKAFLLITLIILFYPLSLLSAEVLQVTGAEIVQIGDQNRNYKVKLACIGIDSSKEKDAIDWLKVKLPRHTKINILPKGSDDGILVANIINLKTKEDISNSIAEAGLANFTCDS